MTGAFLDWRRAFDEPVTLWIAAGIGGLLALAFLIVGALSLAGLVKGEFRRELWQRTLAWAVMAPLLVVPILLGKGPTIGAMTLLALWCYREYARATGLDREKLVSVVVVLGILLLAFAALDHWYGFWVALFPLTVCTIAAVSILPDSPKGYLQRVALGVLGFMLFGAALGHVSYMANDANYRPIVLMLFVGVQVNDVLAFCCGRLFGRTHLVPRTSPNKTLAGHLGALVLTTPLVATMAHFVFRGSALDHWGWLVLLGALVSSTGQLGDLMLSSIKRDLGIKDMATTIPGHGGALDRFNSVLLAAPTVFHYVGLFVGFGLDQPTRVFTGP